jgi:RNA polymerase sigma factor (sigma-70 family)
MKKNWVLSQESFDTLLDWLAGNRELAGQKYEEIRHRVIRIFAGRGCYEPEDLADETINRVASKVHEIRESYSGDPALYFYAVAKNIHKEYLRRRPTHISPVVLIDSSKQDEQFRCLEECLDLLSADSRELVIQYYQEEKKAKIHQRKLLAQRLGIAPNALRIRACRIRASLLECVEKCLGQDVS